jgi:hypothetical protein
LTLPQKYAGNSEGVILVGIILVVYTINIPYIYRMSKQNPKKKTSFSISENVDKLLAKLADKNSRSKASMLEVLIKEAAAANQITSD